MEIFNKEFVRLADELELTEQQKEEVAQTISINSKICMSCFKSKDKEKYSKEFLEPYFDQIVQCKK